VLGDYAKGVGILSDLYLDTMDANYIFTTRRAASSRTAAGRRPSGHSPVRQPLSRLAGGRLWIDVVAMFGELP
jgi:hypothetical protein